MSLEAQFLNAAVSERGERVRFTEALAVFEDMHRTLKARVAETPEHRALDGLDAVLALVIPGERRTGRHLDLEGFTAFRGSVELLHDNTPESRALQLFEGALRSMIASASDFDDLPDADESENLAAANDSETADSEEDAPVIVAILEAEPASQDEAIEATEAEEAPAPGEPEAERAAEADHAAHETHDAETESASEDVAAEHDTADHGDAAVPDADPAEIEQRIVELETELAAARSHQAA